MVALACANQTVQGPGIRVTVAFGQPAAAPVDQFGDPYRVFNFIARYGGHRLHPVLRRVRVEVTCQQFKCVARGFTLQVHVVVEQARQLDRLRDRLMSCGVFYPQPA